MFIRTERLFLRPAWPEDYDDLRIMLEEKGVDRMGELALPVDPAIVRQYLGVDRDPRLPIFMISQRTASGPVVVGAIGLARTRNGDVELGYWIVPAHRGQGFAMESVDAVLHHAAMLGHRQLVARHCVRQEDIGRVYEAAGFRPTGELVMSEPDLADGDDLEQLYVVETGRWLPTHAPGPVPRAH